LADVNQVITPAISVANFVQILVDELFSNFFIPHKGGIDIFENINRTHVMFAQSCWWRWHAVITNGSCESSRFLKKASEIDVVHISLEKLG
jgi:hypothetical protein